MVRSFNRVLIFTMMDPVYLDDDGIKLRSTGESYPMHSSSLLRRILSRILILQW